MKARILVLSLCMAGWTVALRDFVNAQEAAPQVVVAKPLVRDVTDRDEFIGRFRAAEQVDIRSRVGGYLQSIAFKDGQLVKDGDELFKVDQRPFVTALSQAKASLAVANAGLASDAVAQIGLCSFHAILTSSMSAILSWSRRTRCIKNDRKDNMMFRDRPVHVDLVRAV
ncbi:multidrug efflux pump subunit AcrA (membrane-fusion protein) [Rhizobium pisi]|uniref:Multidrug efflux pump subunit AcrA (Membrane-fusion protein) n=1 Tax=Rhizobium pisi TaxID=574561 RepID=A0A7W5BS48_9HYPH|nr:multidrug efflux pump subunit AcrA (membrane-fusion protein) [Rhizobium pisi]